MHVLNVKYLFPLIKAMIDLKTLPRKGWLEHGIPARKTESVASHSFATAVTIIILKHLGMLPEGLKYQEALEIAILHDIHEAITGDITPRDNVPTIQKCAKEEQAIHNLMLREPALRKLMKFLVEFTKTNVECNASRESRYVKQIDKLEMMIQALFYEKYENVDLLNFYGDYNAILTEPSLMLLFEQIKKELNNRSGKDAN